MKKIVLTGFVASMAIAAPAFAEVTDASLTTKGYVDSGLRALYSTTKGVTDTLDTRVTNLESYVGADSSSGLRGAVSSLQSIVGASDTTGMRGEIADLQNVVTGTDGEGGLAAAVNTLQSQMESLQTNGGDTTAYTAGANGGITVSNHEISVTGLADTKSNENRESMYVYKDGSLQKLPVADTWDTSFNFAGN